MKISVSDAFDGGNIELVEQRRPAVLADGGDGASITELVLKIKPDVYTELEEIAHLQYFCFRVTVSPAADDDDDDDGAVEEEEDPSSAISKKKVIVRFVIQNAERTSYPEAWSGFTVFYTTNVDDADSWRRNVDTLYAGGALQWEQTFETTAGGSWYYAFFPPYSYQRHLDFVARCTASAHCRVISLGQSLAGREIECVVAGRGDRTAWIIHRQHPGESMAEYYAEGLLTRLLGLPSDGVLDDDVQRLLQLYTFYIVPCMCPDGSVMGHLRTNRAGANLNREWTGKGDYAAPTLERSPEVYHVLRTMDRTGCDLFLDVHGDEEIPYNFISGARHVPNWCQRLESLHGAFCAAYGRAATDFQRTYGYPPAEDAATALQYMNVATNQVGNRFRCLAMTLEMPFKDCRSHPDPDRGWSPERSRQLGAACVAPLLYVHPYLRADDASEFWNALPADDGFVVMTDDYELGDPSERDEGFVRLHKRYFSDVHEWRKPHHPHPDNSEEEVERSK